LHQAQTMFNSAVAQLTIFPALRGEKAFRTTVRRGLADNVMEAVHLADLDDVLDAETDGVILQRSRSAPSIRQMLERRGVEHAMVGLLRGRARILGSLFVGGYAESRVFDERDLQRLQALVRQT